MRWLIAFSASAALCLAPNALAQGDAPAAPSMAKAPSGNDAATRDAELARFLAAPETVHPLQYQQFALALHDAGRDVEAVAWFARGLVRLRVDVAFLERSAGASSLDDYSSFGEEAFLPSLIRGEGSETARAVVEDAIAWELATPRRYDIHALTSHSIESYSAGLRGRDLSVNMSPDARALFVETQARVIADMRALMEREIAARDLETEAYGAAAARRPAREAIETVPVNARTRLTPLRTVRLACTGPVAFVDGGPLTPDGRRTALKCMRLLASEYQIVDLVGGETLQRASVEPFYDSGAFAFVNGGDVTLVARRSNEDSPLGAPHSGRAPLWAMRADRALAPLTLPPPPELSDSARAQLHPSMASSTGRYAYVHFRDGASMSTGALYDVAAQRLVWSDACAERGRRRDLSCRVAWLIDETEEAPALISGIITKRGDASPSIAALERLNLDTGAGISADWPVDAVIQLPYRHDERRMLMALDAPIGAPNAMLLDLSTLTTVWRGREEELPPGSYSHPVCKPLVRVSERGAHVLATLMGVGEPVAFDPARRSAPADCAVSSDGRTLALMLAPFVHVYRIEPN